MTIDLLGFNLTNVNTGEYFNQDSDLVGVEPLLGPLTSNGDRAQTHALLVGSPAINAGGPLG
ncbi:MAG: choice-of-anchor Q domain-containing protein [Xanthomonadales bacterium]|nr:choice-of-anchor Q domain-containing protein [Xanthomonadales bacterium]